MKLTILDDVIRNPHQYVDDILSGDFVNVEDGDNLFKGIQVRGDDELKEFISKLLPNYTVSYNFVRQSPKGQVEPNFIHSDEMMGDKTILLYLNKTYPKKAGTTMYDVEETASCSVYMKFNRLLIFDSHHKHARNFIDNFGNGKNSRLVQIMFVKLTHKEEGVYYG
jgi:hypothetical protein